MTIYEDMLNFQKATNKATLCSDPWYIWYSEDAQKAWKNEVHSQKVLEEVKLRMKARGWIK